MKASFYPIFRISRLTQSFRKFRFHHFLISRFPRFLNTSFSPIFRKSRFNHFYRLAKCQKQVYNVVNQVQSQVGDMDQSMPGGSAQHPSQVCL